MELILEQVTHRYGDLLVLEGIDLEIRTGEIVALIGPSGCGKSTLLGILGGLVRPVAGRVLQLGNAPASCLNALTFVFQDFALLPWRDVAGNVALPLEHHGLPGGEIARRVATALAMIGLAEFASAYPKQLSGGMRQRVGIARALVVEPAVLLMDEPLSALDAQTRELLMEDLLKLWNATRFASVYVTHNLAEAVRIAHRVVVLSRRPGRVREIVEITIAHADRDSVAAAGDLKQLQDRLWRAMKAEAQIAEREILDHA